MQIWKIDKNGLYVGETYFVEESNEFEISEPCNTSEDNTFYKPKWDGEKWVEGATQEEIDTINKIDNCTPSPTTEERFTKLEEEKSILAENVYQLASIVEVILTGGTEDDETGTVATDTTN